LSAAQRERILSRIRTEDQGRVWGYTRDAPMDADDTAFVLRTLRNLGRTVELGGLDVFFHEGAFTTFELGPLREPPRLAFEVCLKNNFRVHPEVLANVYRVLADAGLEWRINESLIRASQAPEGYFHSYFYPSRYYCTWMTAELLAVTGRLQEVRRRAVQFVAESQHQDGSWGHPGDAYETALALSICRREEINRTQVERAVAFLLANQDSEGSWRTCRPIWAFRHKDEPVLMWEAFDTNGMVATALAVNALRRHEGSLVG
jgi:hypothetical protein